MKILEMKSTITEINNSLEGLNSRIELAEKRICALKDCKIESMQSKEQRVKLMKKNE